MATIGIEDSVYLMDSCALPTGEFVSLGDIVVCDGKEEVVTRISLRKDNDHVFINRKGIGDYSAVVLDLKVMDEDRYID